MKAKYLHIILIPADNKEDKKVSRTACGRTVYLDSNHLYAENVKETSLLELEKIYSRPYVKFKSQYKYENNIVGKKACRDCLRKEPLYILGQVKLT